MKALLFRSVRRIATLLGRSAGVAVTASAAIVSAHTPAMSRPAITLPAGSTAKSQVAPAIDPAKSDFSLDGTLSRTPAYPTAIEWFARRAGNDDPLPAPALNAATAASAHDMDLAPARAMPGWLEAETRLKAGLPGQTPRPLSRAAARRPRPGNRPARDRQTPKRTPAHKVVWIANRAAA